MNDDTDRAPGRPPIPRHKTEAALAMFKSGRTQRAIAAALGISRGTVGAICRGQWARKAFLPKKIKGLDRWPFDVTRQERCPHCGWLVHPPCLACALGFEGSSVGTSERRRGDGRERLRGGESACVARIF